MSTVRTCFDERGFTMPLLVLMLVFSLVVACGFTEFSSITSAKCLLDNKLSGVKESACSTSFALEVKNAENPGEAIAQKVCELMRKEGLNEDCTVWVYEVPASDISADERLVVWMAETNISYPFIASGLFGEDSMSISSHISGSFKPYSESTTWRPSNSGNGTYIFAAGSTDATYSSAAKVDGNYPTEFAALLANLNK